jgi:hypothetical protein
MFDILTGSSRVGLPHGTTSMDSTVGINPIVEADPRVGAGSTHGSAQDRHTGLPRIDTRVDPYNNSPHTSGRRNTLGNSTVSSSLLLDALMRKGVVFDIRMDLHLQDRRSFFAVCLLKVENDAITSLDSGYATRFIHVNLCLSKFLVDIRQSP